YVRLNALAGALKTAVVERKKEKTGKIFLCFRTEHCKCGVIYCRFNGQLKNLKSDVVPKLKNFLLPSQYLFLGKQICTWC
uniref:Uncharacterized protein n=1 Tax=Dromaius novaehollandiae TaxID=8790 RepID=A0A8C4PCD8_DRONO